MAVSKTILSISSFVFMSIVCDAGEGNSPHAHELWHKMVFQEGSGDEAMIRPWKISMMTVGVVKEDPHSCKKSEFAFIVDHPMASRLAGDSLKPLNEIPKEKHFKPKKCITDGDIQGCNESGGECKFADICKIDENDIQSNEDRKMICVASCEHQMVAHACARDDLAHRNFTEFNGCHDDVDSDMTDKEVKEHMNLCKIYALASCRAETPCQPIGPITLFGTTLDHISLCGGVESDYYKNCDKIKVSK